MDDDMKFARNLIGGIVGVVLLIVWSITCWHIVPPGHRGVVITLGRVSPEVVGEGFTWKRPFGLRSIVDMPIQQITVKGVAPSYSADLQQITVYYSALYRIPEGVVATLYQQFKGDPYTQLVEPRLQDAIKQVISRRTAEDVIKNRDQLKPLVLAIVRGELSGLVEMIDVPIANTELTDELEKAIEAKQVQQQQALAKVYELQKAQKDAEIAVVVATAEAQSVKIKGEALKASPEVIQLEIAKKWNGVSPQSVVVTAGGANVLLPLK